METIYTAYYQSPIGKMIIGSHQNRLCICDWIVNKRHSSIDKRIRHHLNAQYKSGTSPVIEQTKKELNEYFVGHRSQFDIPIVLIGSDFQCAVWSEIMRIPYGETTSYRELAHCINNSKAVQAVASATASNPISILVPCHRVIGSNKRLTGYNGGLNSKQHLLNLEFTNTVNKFLF